MLINIKYTINIDIKLLGADKILFVMLSCQKRIPEQRTRDVDSREVLKAEYAAVHTQVEEKLSVWKGGLYYCCPSETMLLVYNRVVRETREGE